MVHILGSHLHLGIFQPQHGILIVFINRTFKYTPSASHFILRCLPDGVGDPIGGAFSIHSDSILKPGTLSQLILGQLLLIRNLLLGLLKVDLNEREKLIFLFFFFFSFSFQNIALEPVHAACEYLLLSFRSLSKQLLRTKSNMLVQQQPKRKKNKKNQKKHKEGPAYVICTAAADLFLIVCDMVV
jgi:hypothetical protein